jgi:hypothetical protein
MRLSVAFFLLFLANQRSAGDIVARGRERFTLAPDSPLSSKMLVRRTRFKRGML